MTEPSDQNLITAMTAVIERHHPNPDHVGLQAPAEDIARELLPVVRGVFRGAIVAAEHGRCEWCGEVARLSALLSVHHLYLVQHQNADGEDCPGSHGDDWVETTR